MPSGASQTATRLGRGCCSHLLFLLFFWNFFESFWMRGFEFLWVMFVIVAAEIGRYWQPLPLRKVAQESRGRRPARPGQSLSRSGASAAHWAVMTFCLDLLGSVYEAHACGRVFQPHG